VLQPAGDISAGISNPARSFSYDGGNVSADGNFSAVYDLSARMSSLTKAGVTTTYSYDGFGRRVRKVSSTGAASTVIFAYDQDGQLLGEYDSTGAAIREYVWLGNIPIAVFMPDPAGSTNPPLVYFIHADHLNTPRVVVDKGNNIRWRWMAEPFGVMWRRRIRTAWGCSPSTCACRDSTLTKSRGCSTTAQGTTIL
jgi:YD repeat-containing protein